MAFFRRGDSSSGSPKEAKPQTDSGQEPVGSKNELAITTEHLQIVNRILSATMGPYEVPEMLELLVREIVDVLGVRWGTIKLSTEEKDVAQTMVRRPGIQAGTVPRVIENTAFFLVMGAGEALVINDLEEDSRFPKPQGEKVGSLLAVPVHFRGEAMGVMTLVDRVDGGVFSRSDLALATYLASEAGPIIRNAQLMEDAFRQKALEHERELAESVWRRLLPERLPELDGFEVAAHCMPARMIGGDYYDLIPLDGGRFILALGDVSGSGMPAALLMSNLQAALRATSRVQHDPSELVRQVNEHIHSTTTPERYATLFVGLLDPAACRVDYVNAGHNPPLLVSPGGRIEELQATGMPIGFLSGAPYEARSVSLEPGTRLVVFSDGITESFSRQEEMFGESRLADLVSRHANVTSQELIDSVFAAVGEWCQGSDFYQDDCTLLVLSCVGR